VSLANRLPARGPTPVGLSSKLAGPSLARPPLPTTPEPLTGWKHESIGQWIEQSLLESHATTVRGKPWLVVISPLLLASNRRHMPVSGLAKLADMAAMAVKAEGLDTLGMRVGRAGRTWSRK
jgi:hypothetical protein